MHGNEKPKIRTVKKGAVLVEQGNPGDEIFLLLDGVLLVEVDGKPVVEAGPGAILGVHAPLEGGVRTSTLRAVTPCKVAVARRDQVVGTRSKRSLFASGESNRDDAGGD